MVCAVVFVSRMWSVPESVCNHSQGLLLPSRHRKRSIDFRVLPKQTNKQTNKQEIFRVQQNSREQPSKLHHVFSYIVCGPDSHKEDKTNCFRYIRLVVLRFESVWCKVSLLMVQYVFTLDWWICIREHDRPPKGKNIYSIFSRYSKPLVGLFEQYSTGLLPLLLPHHSTIHMHFTVRTPAGVMTTQSHSVYHFT